MKKEREQKSEREFGDLLFFTSSKTEATLSFSYQLFLTA
jgi:hypothetical protein